MSMSQKRRVFFLGETDVHTYDENILSKIKIGDPIELGDSSSPLLNLQFVSGYKKDGTRILSCEAVLDVENLGFDNNECIDMLDSQITATMGYARCVIFWHINLVLRKILEFWRQGKTQISWRVFDENDPCDPMIFYVDKDLHQYALMTSWPYISLMGDIEYKGNTFKDEYKKYIKEHFAMLINDSFLFWESIADNQRAAFRMFRLFFSRDEVSIEEDFENLKQAIMSWIKGS